MFIPRQNTKNISKDGGTDHTRQIVQHIPVFQNGSPTPNVDAYSTVSTVLITFFLLIVCLV